MREQRHDQAGAVFVEQLVAILPVLLENKTLTAAERRACIGGVIWFEAWKMQEDRRDDTDKKVKAQCTH